MTIRPPPLSNTRRTDRLTGFPMPRSVEEWLPQRHLARFIVEVVDGLDPRPVAADGGDQTA